MTDILLFFVHCRGGPGFTSNYSFHSQGENRLRTTTPIQPPDVKPQHQAPRTSQALQCTRCCTSAAAKRMPGPLLPILLWDQDRRGATFSHSDAEVRDGKGQLMEPLKLNSF